MLTSAVEALRGLGEVVATSHFHDTAAVGYTNQGRFLNAAALLRTDRSPLDVLHTLLLIESKHGRDRSHGIAKGPRTLDLDLLLYDDMDFATDELTLPHPEMHLRRFVLEPLVEIAPDFRHPVLGVTITELLAGLGAEL